MKNPHDHQVTKVVLVIIVFVSILLIIFELDSLKKQREENQDKSGFSYVDSNSMFTPSKDLNEIIKNATYQIEGNEYKLNNGHYTVGDIKDPKTNFTDTFYATSTLGGDINKDGFSDALVILGYSQGNSVVDYPFLLLSQTQDGKLINYFTKPIDFSLEIGYERNINFLKINPNGNFEINMMVVGPNEPRCCPTIKADITYMYDSMSVLRVVKADYGKVNLAKDTFDTLKNYKNDKNNYSLAYPDNLSTVFITADSYFSGSDLLLDVPKSIIDKYVYDTTKYAPSSKLGIIKNTIADAKIYTKVTNDSCELFDGNKFQNNLFSAALSSGDDLTVRSAADAGAGNFYLTYEANKQVGNKCYRVGMLVHELNPGNIYELPDTVSVAITLNDQAIKDLKDLFYRTISGFSITK